MITDHNCDCCANRKATRQVWCREDVTAMRTGSVAYLEDLCDECFAAELARGVVIGMEHDAHPGCFGAACQFRFPTVDVLGTRLATGPTVTLARLGDYESWSPRDALAVAAAIVAAATFAAKQPQSKEPT